MKKTLLLLLALLGVGSSGAWAENYIRPSASKVNTVVSGGYYVIDGLAQDGTTGHYLYDNGSKVVSGSIPTDITASKFAWKIVGNSSEGYTLQNKATGNYMNLGSSSGSAISTSTTSQTNVIYFTSDSYATICNASTLQAIDINADGTNPITWSGSTTSAEGSRRLMIYDVAITLNEVYTIKSYFKDYTNLYFYNNDGNLAFSTDASHSVKDYWVARSSGNTTYPWKFESGRGDGKFLSPKDGLSDLGGWMQVPYCTSITGETCVHLYGSTSDASSENLRYLATWNGSTNTGFAQYGKGGCYGGSHNNSDWSTDYIIEQVTDVDLFSVVSNLNSGGVIYDNEDYKGLTTQTNDGFYILTSEPSSSDFTAIAVSGYTPGDIIVDLSDKTITVNYATSYSYTLTDMNGATYSGNATGSFGTSPIFTGCAGYTLSNEVWDEDNLTYSANISFPFTVSSNGVTNHTYIGSFAGLSRTLQYAWHVESSEAKDIITQSNVLPTNEPGEIEKWEWTIIPSFSAGAFTFTLKNVATDLFITCSSSQHDHNQGSVTLSTDGTSFTYVDNAWKSDSYYLSVNSYQPNPADLIQYVGQWNQTHYGTVVGFPEPANFNSLLSNLKVAYNSFNAYMPYWSSGTYSETEEGLMMSVYGNNEAVRNVIKDSPTNYLTAAQFQTYANAYNDAVDGLTYVMPTGKFIRIKNAEGTKFAKVLTTSYTSEMQLDFTVGGTDASSIFYVNSSNNMIPFNSGSYLTAVNHTCRIDYFNWICSYEFLKGSSPLKVYVHAATNPIGWGGENTYWQYTDGSDKVGRITSESASEFLIEEVTSLPVTITGAGYATLWSPVALTIPTDVTAYTAEDKGEYLTLTAIEGGIIPAESGVILAGEAGTYNFEITTGGNVEGNALTGQAAAQTRPTGSYILATGSAGVGFYADGAQTIPGFKAYLPAGTGDVKAFRFNDATAIDAISSELSQSAVYDLQGRRVSQPAHGLYIVNGKKVVIK